MKKGLTVLLAAVSAAAVAAPAMAQDDRTFTGPRVEALVGYDIVKPGSTVDIDNNDAVDQSIKDPTYGVGAGFDFDFGGLVAGVEGEYLWPEARTNYNTTGFTGFGVSNVEAGRELYAGVRAGVKVGSNALLYAKGGYTNASFDVLASDNVTDTLTNAKLDGWRVGAGAEYAITRNLFVKGEYRYSNYAKGEFEAPSGLESDRFDVDLDRHQFMVGVGARL